MSAERRLAPWLQGSSIETLGRVSSKRRPPSIRTRLTFADRRQQLLGASLMAFVSRGLELTTMDTIAAQAGVSKPLVYRHFPNRFEALLAVVDQQAQGLLDELDLAASPNLSEVIVSYFRFVGRSPAGFRLLFQMVDGSPGAARRRIQALRLHLEEAALAATLREAEADLEAAAAARRAGLGALLISILEGVAGALREGDDPASRAEAVRRLLDPRWVLGSIAPRSQPLAGPQVELPGRRA